MHINRIVTVFCCLVVACVEAKADDINFFEQEQASLIDYLDRKTTIASLLKNTLRQTPGVVTVFTEDDIQLSGARNLVDLLETVPGFYFALDTEGNLGLGVRGNWATEGKVLVVIDGFQQNEFLSSTVQFDRIPVEQIAKVEVIRGPGSAIYGGNAELAVIDITTKGLNQSPKGAEVYAAYGRMAGTFGRSYSGFGWNGDLATGKFKTLIHYGEASRSDQRYTDSIGQSYIMAKQSGIRTANLNMAWEKNGFLLRALADGHALEQRDYFGVSAERTMLTGFESYWASAQYAYKVSDAFSVTPILSYNFGLPWNVASPQAFSYQKQTQHMAAALNSLYSVNDYVTVLSGAQYFNNSAMVSANTNILYQYADGSKYQSYNNFSYFAQASLLLKGNNLTAGARYDWNSQYGDSLVPRVSFTRAAEKYHFKAVLNSAFKAPSIENMAYAPGIIPERTYSAELEAGLSLTQNSYFTGDVFLTKIKDPIVYDTSGGLDNYKNFDTTGSSGYEIQYLYKNKRFSFNASYAAYQARYNRVLAYQVPDKNRYLAFPTDRVTASFVVRRLYGLDVSPSVIWQGARYGYTDIGLRRFNSGAVWNLQLLKKEFLMEELTASFIIRDVFNEGTLYIQPYDSGHPPLPGASREILLKLHWKF